MSRRVCSWRTIVAAPLVLVAGAALGGCSDDGQEAAPQVTVTETVTQEASPDAGTPSEPAASPSDGGAASGAPSDEPSTGAGGGGEALPTDAAGYAQALIDAWQAGDYDAALRLVRDPDDAEDLFDEDDLRGGAPTAAGCEGAAGSSYCTFTGQNYQVVVRVANEAASQGAEGAISDVDVED